MKTNIKSKKVVVQNKWTSIIEESFTFDDNREGTYIIVEREPAIMVIPVIKSESKYYTYLVKQFRYPINTAVWQFPMGTQEKGATPEECAKKELVEETGLIANTICFAGEYYIDPGLSRQKCMVFIAEQVIEGGSQNLEETEKGLIAQRFSIEELEELVKSNQNIDGWIYPGLYFLSKYINNHL